MSDDPDKLTRFWQELKRRKVIYVITVYASAAFVIIELVGNVTGPLNLPERISTIAIIVLAIGFPIVVILSWIFDLTPKGVERTKPFSEVQEDERPVIQNRWKIATYVSIAVIIGLIALNIFNLNKVTANLTQYGKSIAVMPFINDTPDEENVYFVNGAMESILNNLSTIKDLKVLPRRSVEQYRDKILPIPEIAAAQQVSYVLEGSMQKYEDQIRITLTLSDQNNSQLWSRQYDREIKRAEEYFAFWSEIAQLVAEELKVVITPEEKQRIEKIPTTSLTAQSYFQRGWDIFVEYYLEKGPKDTNKLNTAEHFFRQALDYDSTYAPAYMELAWVVFESGWRYNSFQVKMDSMLSLANKALSYDDQLAEAYGIRGLYYQSHGEREKGLNEYNTALKFNPNDWFALKQIAVFYFSRTNIPRALEYLHRALWHTTGNAVEIRGVLGRLAETYLIAGFPEKAEFYYHELFKFTMDTSVYYAGLSMIELFSCNWDKLIKTCNKRLALNSNDLDALLNKGAAYVVLKEYKESLVCFEKLIDGMNATGDTIYYSMKWISYAYWKTGDMKLAEFYLDKELEYYNSLIPRNWPWIYIHNAMALAYRGMKKEALTNLRVFNDLMEKQNHNNISMMTNWPFFDGMRDDPEFRKILNDMEAKYQAEHERVRQWLEENNML